MRDGCSQLHTVYTLIEQARTLRDIANASATDHSRQQTMTLTTFCISTLDQGK